MPKFFFTSETALGGTFLLTGDVADHIRVLRMKPGEELTVCDGQGSDHFCVIRELSPDGVLVEQLSSLPSRTEPRIFCSVYMAFPKAEKLEHVIQKATELGACEIVAFPSARCVSRPDEKSLRKKLERWQKIAASASEQSGRGRVPQVLVMESFAAALKRAAACDLALFPYENEQKLGIRQAIGEAPFSTVSIVTGPEGGFTPEEAALAQQSGMKLCSLGPRILRCETAPLCTLSAVLFASGDLDT